MAMSFVFAASSISTALPGKLVVINLFTDDPFPLLSVDVGATLMQDLWSVEVVAVESLQRAK